MSSNRTDHTSEQFETGPRTSLGISLAVAAAVTVVHLATNGRYGFHRDELQFLSDARHLDWGFVAYPPLTPVLERIGLNIFGLSLVGLRLFSVIAQATVIILTGLMALDLGGGKLAQLTATLAVALSPLPLFEGTEFQYTSFENLWWVLIAYFTIRMLKSENPRWCLAIGAAVGMGLLTKYSIVFFIAGVLGGLVLSQARRFLLNRWFWAGMGLAFLIVLPNLLWQLNHGFISYQFLHHIHVRDVGEGRANGFLRDQILICINVFATPLVVVGLIAFLRNPRYRMLAWMHIIPLALFALAKGRGYYMGAAYPMLLAMGSVVSERWIQCRPKLPRLALQSVFFTGLAVCGAFICAVILPIQSAGPLRDFALRNNGDLREEFGWPELVTTVAGIRDSLPAGQQPSVGVLTGNYGEQGAIEILGPAYRLPSPISMTNSSWLRGYPAQPPTTLIVIGFSQQAADRAFTGCRLAGHNGNPYGISNEESEAHPDIFLCGPPRQPWPQFWRDYRAFG